MYITSLQTELSHTQHSLPDALSMVMGLCPYSWDIISIAVTAQSTSTSITETFTHTILDYLAQELPGSIQVCCKGVVREGDSDRRS